MAEKIVQTAGRDQLGEFAPMFAHLNDDCVKIGLNRKRSDFVCQKGFIRQRCHIKS